LIVKSPRWQRTALAAAALIGLWGSNAMALSLGRITVQSALGEPLRAEIEVPDINAEEASSLKASVAMPEAFKAAGLEYSPAMAGMQVTVQRRSDGRTYIRLSSDRAINDPFVDMIIEASWSTGRIVRDYTMLFDPPALRQPPPPTQAQTPSPAGKVAAPGAVAPSRTPAQAAEPSPRNTADSAARATLAKTPGTPAEQVTVKSGDTASKIAAAAKPATVSLDQMLVALLRANPAAFAGDNVNRVKAGAVITLPTAEQASAIPTAEAKQVIVAQSKDFNDYRRKLAGSAPTTQVAAAERQTSGSVQTKVEDKKPVTKAPDKLTLSKGAAVQGKLSEDQLAKDRIAKEAASRAAEISKNINDLSKLGVASNAAAPGLTASTALPAPVSPAVVTTAATSTASAPSSITAASTSPLASPNQAASAPTPAASSTAKRPEVASDLPAQPSIVDELIENPLVPAGAVGLIALLAGLGFYRARQRKANGPVDSVLDESRLQPDSFFGASGGQSVDTNDSAATGSSMVYSPSQLEAADDVDPVAEADVYLAYGRDLQAEEILRSALGTNPGRIAIHLKLLEILAKRQDVQGFEGIATQAFKVTTGEGQDWERVCELGLSIDPSNALYQPGGQPASLEGTPTAPAPLDLTSAPDDNASALATQAIAPQASPSVDLDLDLDFSLDEEASSGAVAETTAGPTDTAAPAIDMDFGLLDETPEPVEPPRSEAIKDAVNFSLPELEIAGDGLTLQPGDSEEAKPSVATAAASANAAPVEPSEPKAAPQADLDMLEFDLGSLSLDLGNEPPAPAPAAPGTPEDPLATKLALAQEFSAIGDDDGARALIEEVIAEASGDMKIKAQSALANL
jgi:pilus assembly protein FimV